MFIDEYFDDPVIRLLAIFFCVCSTNFSISGGEAVIVHVLDSTVKQARMLTYFTVRIV